MDCRIKIIIVLLLVALCGSAAAAEERAAFQDVRPPTPIELAEAPFPPGVQVDEAIVRVVLRLTVDETGKVLEAEIAESAGPAFDEAARTAALSSRFAPALRGGTPVPARILFAWDFPVPEREGALTGRVLLPGEGETPAVGAEVVVTGEDQLARSQRTDEQGRFHFESLPPGAYALRAQAGALGEASLQTVVTAGETTVSSLRLSPRTELKPLEVRVEGASESARLRRSAQAVQVVETAEAQQQTADLGEVLARSEGIGVQRGGGLGSGTRFSLNGLTDDQVRFLLDGLPLELTGFPSGISNVPVNLIERVEIYRGVVPIRFGADALGGAVNLVSEEDVRGTHGALSYQGGAFGTHRLTLNARHLQEATGLFARVGGFLDRADNDYPVEVEVPDSRGRLAPATAYRFNDGYRAAGLQLEGGFLDRPWAKRLLLRGFFSQSQKELQNNLVMTVPYGEAAFNRSTAGATVRYEQLLSERVSVDLAASYSYGQTHFVDESTCVYNWFGQCVFQRVQPGEISSRPVDQLVWQHTGLARLNLAWQLRPEQALRFAFAPTIVTRTGDERSPRPPGTREPVSAVHDLFTLVSGLEHEIDLFDDRLENLLFVKDYLQLARSVETLPSEDLLELDRTSHQVGVGDALRFQFTEFLQAKASWEWAVRLPRADEAFGDGVFIAANPELEPETSHNLNLGVTAELPESSLGSLRAELNGFLRNADRLIVLLGNDNVFAYQNVHGARSLGVEAGAGWTLPGEVLALEANATWQDFRNTSSEGAFRDFVGDRIPNRPYLFANGSARLQFREVARASDELSLTWNLRYVHAFFRGWESVGARATKQAVPAQTLQALALTYAVKGNPLGLGFTAEVQNLSDSPAYDFFGVQRPGRAFYFKTTLSL